MGIIEIVEASPASETCEYVANDGRTYLIEVEVEPTIAARTLMYRDDRGNPIYLIRWSSKISVKVMK